MGKCPFCGNNIDDDTLYCRSCGKKISSELRTNRRGSGKEVWIVLLLIFMWPIGLISMWLTKSFSKKTRLIITSVFAAFILITFIGVISKWQEGSLSTGSEEMVVTEMTGEQSENSTISLKPNDVAAIIFVIVVSVVIIYFVTRKPKQTEIQPKLYEQGDYSSISSTPSDPIKGKFRHVNGLGFAENTLCDVVSYPTFYEFKAGAVNYNLSKEKVIDVTVKTDREIQQQYVSSIGGAVAGGVLFGPLGAIIGGRAKKKSIKTYSSYLIITYKDGENIKYIGFDVTSAPFKAKKFENEFKRTNNTVTRVEL